MKRIRQSKKANLRRRAELQVRQGAVSHPVGLEQDMAATLHELRVHQIELQMQNEELVQAKAAIEQGLERYTEIFDFAPVSYFALDRHGRILKANLPGTLVLGVERSQLLGRGFERFLKPADVDCFRGLLRDSLLSGKRELAELDVVTLGGRSFFARFEVLSSRDGLACHLVIIDLSERRRVEIELQKGREKAELASRAKSSFLSNMSHELRTPLNGIIGMIDVVLSTTLTPRQRRCLDMAQTCSHDLLGLINDLLDLARIEASRLELSYSTFALRAALKEREEIFRVLGNAKNVAFELHVSAEVPDNMHSDLFRLKQVLNNLLSNALKFTHVGKVVLEVSKSVLADGKPMFLFSVSDSGIGIPQDKIGELFSVFGQIEQGLTRSHEGSGLGLVISKALVELMGGEIWVESEERRGSRFSFTLPFVCH